MAACHGPAGYEGALVQAHDMPGKHQDTPSEQQGRFPTQGGERRCQKGTRGRPKAGDLLLLLLLLPHLYCRRKLYLSAKDHMGITSELGAVSADRKSISFENIPSVQWT